jgi:hypothetical protein
MADAFRRIDAPRGEDGRVIVFFEPACVFPVGKILELLRRGRWAAAEAHERNLRFDNNHIDDRIFTFPEVAYS